MPKNKTEMPEQEAVEQEKKETVTEEQKPKQAAKKQKASGTDMEARLAAAEQMASDAEGKLDEVKDSLMRTAAEYENYRKRSQKENEAAFGNGVGYAACELLPVLDTVEAAANAESSDEEYKKGVLLILDKSKEVFKKMGIEEIDAMGQPFDPELHNAVMQEEAEGAESGTVTRVMQKGYIMHGRVIRHAMVAVAP